MKHFFIFSGILITMAIVYCSTAKMNLSPKNNIISLVDVEALANDENGGDSKTCITTFTTENIMQKCVINGQTVERPMRYSISYGCSGDGEGNCRKGTDYTFYDCFGITGFNDLSTTAQCK